MGGACTARLSPFTVKRIVGQRDSLIAVMRRLLDRLIARELGEQIFRQQRNGIEADAGGVADGIQNRGRGAVVRQFADAFGAVAAVAERNLLKVHVNRRNIFGGGHDVVGHLVVGHVAVLQTTFS